jgi:hypothetical protein
MALLHTSPVRDVHGITPDEETPIKKFLQGAVYSRIKDHPDEWFAARDLVGGVNTDWAGTPPQALYCKHTTAGKQNDDAIKAAGIDLGWLLKSVLDEDWRTFEATKDELVSKYRWVCPQGVSNG